MRTTFTLLSGAPTANGIFCGIIVMLVYDLRPLADIRESTPLRRRERPLPIVILRAAVTTIVRNTYAGMADCSLLDHLSHRAVPRLQVSTAEECGKKISSANAARRLAVSRGRYVRGSHIYRLAAGPAARRDSRSGPYLHIPLHIRNPKRVFETRKAGLTLIGTLGQACYREPAATRAARRAPMLLQCSAMSAFVTAIPYLARSLLTSSQNSSYR